MVEAAGIEPASREGRKKVKLQAYSLFILFPKTPGTGPSGEIPTSSQLK